MTDKYLNIFVVLCVLLNDINEYIFFNYFDFKMKSHAYLHYFSERLKVAEEVPIKDLR